MIAALYKGVGRIECEEVPTPELQPGTVLLKVEACAICGTDRRSYQHGHASIKPPYILGHEIVGTVVGVDSKAVPDLAEDYAASLIIASSPQSAESETVKEYVRYGASPRGMQSLILASKAIALLDGRFCCSTQDVARAALPALRHRLILNFQAEAEDVVTDDVINELVKDSEKRL